MKISGIVTNRFYQRDFFWQIVYEWEDVLKKCLNTDFFKEPWFYKYRFFKGIPYVYDIIMYGKGFYFYYEMNAGNIHTSRNCKHLIPCIIDFWKNEADIEDFERKYSKHKIVLISSREVYEYLMQNQCKIKIEHLPLSISDRYRITPDTHFEKKYDVILMGRQNKILMEWFNRYKEEHPNLIYVYSARKGSKSYYHYSSQGEEIGNIDSREKYISLMRQGRCAFYSTPGTDGQKDAGGFSQVTPRFLELISSGCHVLSRYIENEDTAYFKLNDISPNIDNYQDFKLRMDYALSHEVDMNIYSAYLDNFYTSKCANKLIDILGKY